MVYWVMLVNVDRKNPHAGAIRREFQNPPDRVMTRDPHLRHSAAQRLSPATLAARRKVSSSLATPRLPPPGSAHFRSNTSASTPDTHIRRHNGRPHPSRPLRQGPRACLQHCRYERSVRTSFLLRKHLRLDPASSPGASDTSSSGPPALRLSSAATLPGISEVALCSCRHTQG